MLYQKKNIRVSRMLFWQIFLPILHIQKHPVSNASVILQDYLIFRVKFQ